MKGQEQKVRKLTKPLYGLKQAPHTSYIKLTKNLLKLNFKHSNIDDATMFFKKFGRYIVYLVAYVDDLLKRRNIKRYIASIKKELNKGFEMIDLGYINYYLGIEVTQNTKDIFIS